MKHFVGEFNEEQLRNKEDKVAIEKAKAETGLKYIESEFVKKKGTIVGIKVYLIPDEVYLNSKLI